MDAPAAPPAPPAAAEEAPAAAAAAPEPAPAAADAAAPAAEAPKDAEAPKEEGEGAAAPPPAAPAAPPAEAPAAAAAAAPATDAAAADAPKPADGDAKPADAAAAPAAAADGSGRPIILRLDCGSLIGDAQAVLGATAATAAGGFSSDVVVVDPLHACSLGRATTAQLQKLDGFIEAYKSRVPNLAALNRSALKSHNPYAQEGQRALKRQKSLANGDDAGGAFHHHAGPVGYGGMHGGSHGHGAFGAGGPGAGGPGADFLDRCRDVLARVLSECGPREMCYHVLARDVFYKPVSETFPTIADDYYAKVERPITFGEIERKITRRAYESPQQFADDMRLVFANCRRYNPRPEDLVHRLGARLEGHFEQAWAASGLAAESRARRATAGLAAARFNPCDEAALAAAAAGGGHGGLAERAPSDYAGGGGGGSARRAAKPGGGSRGHGGGGRPSRSHGEASSYGGGGGGGGGGRDDAGYPAPSPGGGYEHQQQVPLDQQQQEEEIVPHDVLTEVAGAIPTLEPEQLEHAVGLLNEGVVVVAPDGETELDFARITRASLMAVDAYIRSVQGLPPREGVVGMTVEQRSEDEDDGQGGNSDDE